MSTDQTKFNNLFYQREGDFSCPLPKAVSIQSEFQSTHRATEDSLGGEGAMEL